METMSVIKIVSTIISGLWLCVACALFGMGIVYIFAGEDRTIALTLYGILAVMISNWSKPEESEE